MDIKLGLSIYNKPWLIRPDSAIQLLDFWEGVKSGEVKWNYEKAKGENENVESTYKIYQKFFSTRGVIVAPESSYDMADFKGFEGASIAVIPISGPIMKNDFCGSFGTNTLRQLVSMASNTDSVKCIIFPIDSPGGTVDGTEAFANEIKNSPKETIAVVDLMCSAAFWIGSPCDKIYASGSTSIIGCIGTMISLQDNTEALKARGVVKRVYYATDSKDKNKAFDDAIKGDGKALIEEMLDPLNDAFLGAVRTNRPGVNEDALSGKDYTAEGAIKMGLIDGIKTFDEVIKSQATQTTFNLFNSKKMEIKTLAELQAQAPEVYAAALKAGAEKERKRINAWRKWESVDAETVNAAIKDGKEMEMEDISDLSEKKINQNKLKDAEAENTPDIKIGEAAAPTTEGKAKSDALKDEFFTLCGIKK